MRCEEKAALSWSARACANKFAYITTYIKEKYCVSLSLNKLFPHTSSIVSFVSYVRIQ